jgi:rhodanese-related sulfurtransferase
MPESSTISPESAAQLIAKQNGHPGFLLVDVRTPAEYRRGHIRGAVNIEAPDFAREMASLDRDTTYLLYCAAGGRSRRVRELMAAAGFSRVFDIAGGYDAWKQRGFP